MLKASSERLKGSRTSRRLRLQGKVPGVVYGHKEDSISIVVDFPDLRAVMTTDAGVNAVISLEVDGKRQLSIVKDIQYHPIRHDVVHVDFLRIDPEEEVEVEVPINLVGQSKKVEQEKGIVDQSLFTLLVLARPDSIPNELEFDISELEVGMTVTVGQISLPAGVRTSLDEDTPVASAELTRMALVEEIPVEGEEGEEVEGEEGEADAEGEGGASVQDAGGEDSGKGDEGSAGETGS